MVLNDQTEYKINLNGEELAKVDDFKYLGSYVGSTESDITARIGLTWSAFNSLKTILTSRSLSIGLRMRIFNASCISILLYGCETWTLTEELSDKLDVFARTIYRIILGINQSDSHVTNEELYEMVRQHPISQEIRKRQLSFIGHCLRMPEDEPANIYALYESKVRNRNRIGRHPSSYHQQIARYINPDKMLKITVGEITNLAKAKDRWKKLLAVP